MVRTETLSHEMKSLEMSKDEPNIGDIDVLDSLTHERLWAIINNRHEQFNGDTWDIYEGEQG